MKIFLTISVVQMTGIKIVLIIILSCICSLVEARIGRGCYVGGVLYTENTSAGNRFFYRSPGNLISNCGFTPTGTNDGNCRLYNSGNINNNSSYTLYNGAFSNGWDEIICPIDDYVWLLLIAVAGFTIFKLRLPLFINFKKS